MKHLKKIFIISFSVFLLFFPSFALTSNINKMPQNFIVKEQKKENKKKIIKNKKNKLTKENKKKIIKNKKNKLTKKSVYLSPLFTLTPDERKKAIAQANLIINGGTEEDPAFNQKDDDLTLEEKENLLSGLEE